MKNLIQKYFDPATATEEKAALLAEIYQDDELKKEFVEYTNVKALLSLNLAPGDQQEARVAYKRFIRERKRRSARRIFLGIVSYASVALVLIGLTWYMTRLRTRQNIYEEILTVNTVSVPPGQRVMVTQNDGSEVWLNSQSTMQYSSSFNDSERRVKLSGEAHFQVAPNKEVPFIVETETLTVNVTGTTFNVADYRNIDLAEVALLEGSVSVAVRGWEEVIDLKPGEYLRYKGGVVSYGMIDPNNYLWTGGIYYFDRTPLEEIARKLELYFDVRIHIQDPELGQRLYTGKFRQQDGVAEILRIIQRTYPFKIEREELSDIFTIKP